ncbi:MAG TPA: zf-HC2 domain-containing protein [Candidatus Binatia bacterium]|jgi:anti-sigma factor (TIGR02949 family)|nr:zf-HC2 domain-containing protein [Candidatus Binatia bacterium]
MKCEQAEELISALIDNELSDPERSSIEGHLRDCPRCQRAYEWERSLNREIRTVSASVVAPVDLRQRILSDQRTMPKEAESSNGRSKLILRLQPFLRPAFASALLVILVISMFFLMQPPSQSISLAALQIRAKIDRGEVSLREATNTDELHAWLHHAVHGKFGPLGYDFSPLGVKPIGGTVQEVKGRQILVAFFRGNGLSITCFTFLGTEEDAPKEATVFFDPETKIRFYSFSRDGIHAVLHREDNIICMLTSNMPPEELLSLVRSSSPHKHRPGSTE